MQSAGLAACHDEHAHDVIPLPRTSRSGHAHDVPLYPPPVVQGIPAKELAPLHMIPVGQQDFCVCPVAQEVAPLLAGLLAVAPQLLASALIVHHLKAIHL